MYMKRLTLPLHVPDVGIKCRLTQGVKDCLKEIASTIDGLSNGVAADGLEGFEVFPQTSDIAVVSSCLRAFRADEHWAWSDSVTNRAEGLDHTAKGE